MNVQTGIINIRGKEYQTVALRVQLFREQHPDHSLTTNVVCRDDDCVVMHAAIGDPTGRIIATGHAEEYRKSSQINKTSALENAETSAIGRALAAFGLGGTEFASANEVGNAIHQQSTDEGTVGDTAGGGAISPNGPTPRVKLEGPFTSKTALQTAVKGFVHEMHGCGDYDELTAFLRSKDSLALIEQVKRDFPEWWNGGESMPPEFIPLHRQIELKEAEVAQLIADIARA